MRPAERRGGSAWDGGRTAFFLRHGRPSDWTSSAREALLTGRGAGPRPLGRRPGQAPGLGWWGRRTVRRPRRTHPDARNRQDPLRRASSGSDHRGAAAGPHGAAIARRAARPRRRPAGAARLAARARPRRGAPDRRPGPELAAGRAGPPPGAADHRGRARRGRRGDRPAATQEPDPADGPAPAPGRAGAPGANHRASFSGTEDAATTGADATPPPAAEPAAAAPTAAARPGGKLGRVLDAVAAEDGATLAELAALTGWQPHTTRAALTRLRRRGFILVLGSADSAGDRKAYRAVPA